MTRVRTKKITFILSLILASACNESEFGEQRQSPTEPAPVQKPAPKLEKPVPSKIEKSEDVKVEPPPPPKMKEIMLRKALTEKFDNPRCPDGKQSVIEYCSDQSLQKGLLYWCQWKGFDKAVAQTNTGRETRSPSREDCGISGYDAVSKQLKFNTYSDDTRSFNYCTSVTCEKWDYKTITIEESSKFDPKSHGLDETWQEVPEDEKPMSGTTMGSSPSPVD